MFHYWRADCRRIMKRIPRLVILAVIVLVYTIIFFNAAGEEGWNSVEFLSNFVNFIGFMPLAVGLVELNAAYGDDFRARIMQVAIGLGISRRQVVLVKYLETAFLILTDYLFLGIYSLVLAGISGVSLSAEQYGEVAVTLATTWLATQIYSEIAGILAVVMQGTGVATLLYLGLSSTLISSLLSSAFNLQAIRNLHLSRYLLTTASEAFRSRLLLGNFDTGNFLIVMCYLVCAYVLNVLLFRHKELEF